MTSPTDPSRAILARVLDALKSECIHRDMMCDARNYDDPAALLGKIRAAVDEDANYDSVRAALSASQAELARLRPAAEAMAKLEAWLLADPMRTATLSQGPCESASVSLMEHTVHSDPDAYPSVEEWAVTVQSTLPAAILSALARAQEADRG